MIAPRGVARPACPARRVHLEDFRLSGTSAPGPRFHEDEGETVCPPDRNGRVRPGHDGGEALRGDERRGGAARRARRCALAPGGRGR